MIDTWLFAALCLGFLAFCALLQGIPGPERNDRLVSFTASVTLASATALVVCIAWGNLLILDAAIIIALLLFAGIIGCAKFCRSDAR
ncbi:MAG: monovalent cation/H+ antiporter complex subunit F [Methanoregula sp.]|jgi:multisubunit Na+/H+ antiporter MnhF subunit